MCGGDVEKEPSSDAFSGLVGQLDRMNTESGGSGLQGGTSLLRRYLTSLADGGGASVSHTVTPASGAGEGEGSGGSSSGDSTRLSVRGRVLKLLEREEAVEVDMDASMMRTSTLGKRDARSETFALVISAGAVQHGDQVTAAFDAHVAASNLLDDAAATIKSASSDAERNEGRAAVLRANEDLKNASARIRFLGQHGGM